MVGGEPRGQVAIDKEFQGEGLGKALLKDAKLPNKSPHERSWFMPRTMKRMRDTGKFDFEQSPTDPYHLSLLVKDAKASLGLRRP